MTLIQDNIDDFDAICHLVEGLGGVITTPLLLFAPVRGGCMPVQECRLSAEDSVKSMINRSVSKIEEMIPDSLKAKIRIKIKEPTSECNTGMQKMTLLGCSAGMDSYTITYDGKLIGCQTLGVFCTDAVRDGFSEAWENYPFHVHLPEEPDECTKCENKIFCKACPAVRMAECGHLDGVPKYICDFSTALKKEVIG
jgi:radical SAM protein with 4Fe4S-binding SPASM domain